MVVCKVDVRPCDFYGRTMAARGRFASAGEVTPTLYRLKSEMKSCVIWIVGGGFTSSDYTLSNWMQLSGLRNLSRALELRIVPRKRTTWPSIGLGKLSGRFRSLGRTLWTLRNV